MKILVFGASGKVGAELLLRLREDGHEVCGTRRINADLMDPRLATAWIDGVEPQLVINATAMNGMEACEADPFAAYLLNAAAPAIMAGTCKTRGIPFIHYSTDYVFSGCEDGLLEETPPSPSGMYGWSKRHGEESIEHIGGAALIFRLSSIYGRAWSGPLDPVRQAISGKGTVDDPIKVLHQFCAPTSAKAVADATAHVVTALLERPGEIEPGIYHMASSEGVWKVDFAREVVNRSLGAAGPAGRTWHVEEGQLPVPRPIHTQLIADRFSATFDYRMPTWREDLDAMLPLIPKPAAVAA